MTKRLCDGCGKEILGVYYVEEIRVFGVVRAAVGGRLIEAGAATGEPTDALVSKRDLCQACKPPHVGPWNQ